MAGGGQNVVVLELRFQRENAALFLEIGASNRGAQPVTLAAHERYLTIELENAVGQFVNGAEVPGATAVSQLPSAADYRTIAAKNSGALLRVEIEYSAASPGEVHIGRRVFTGVPPRPRVRVTYKASDRTMPNLPRDRQKTFFAGPVDATSEPLVR